MIAQPLLLLAFLLLIIAAARQAEERYSAIQKISSAVVCTLLGILLANIGLIPRGGEFMSSLSRYAIPYAIVLFVLSTRLADLKTAGPRMVLVSGSRGSARSWGLSSPACSSPGSSARRPGSSEEPSPERSGVGVSTSPRWARGSR